MTPASRVPFQALRDYLNLLLNYLNLLLSHDHPDQALDEVPMILQPELEAFLRGKTDVSGQGQPTHDWP